MEDAVKDSVIYEWWRYSIGDQILMRALCDKALKMGAVSDVHSMLKGDFIADFFIQWIDENMHQKYKENKNAFYM